MKTLSVYVMILMSLLCCLPCTAQLEADFNSDGIVDCQDFAIFASQWLTEEPNVADKWLNLNGTQKVAWAHASGISAATNWGSGAGTILFCIQVDAVPSNLPVIMSKGANTDGWLIFITTTGKIQFNRATTAGPPTQSVASDIAICDGKPHWVMITCSSNKMTIYIDGIQHGQSATVTFNTTNSTADFNIGGPSGGYTNPFIGKIDDIRIVAATALTISDAVAVYNNGYGVKATDAWQQSKTPMYSMVVNLDEGTGLPNARTYTAVPGIFSNCASYLCTATWADGGVPFPLPIQSILTGLNSAWNW